jgi:DNA replication protein DnaC
MESWLRRTIPKRFHLSTLENYRPIDDQQRNAKKAIQDNISGSFYLCGTYGRGKTHLLFSQYRRLVCAGARCVVKIGRDITRELTSAEIDGRPSAILLAANSTFPIHFFWDDVDKIKPSEFREEILFDLIDTLYRQQHAITMSSNVDLAGLEGILSAAMIRRLDEVCQVIQI